MPYLNAYNNNNMLFIKSYVVWKKHYFIFYLLIYHIISSYVNSLALQQQTENMQNVNMDSAIKHFLLFVSIAYFSLNLIIHRRTSHLNNRLLLLISYIMLDANLKMLWRNENEIYVSRLVAWGFTIPIIMTIINALDTAKYVRSILFFETSMVLKLIYMLTEQSFIAKCIINFIVHVSAFVSIKDMIGDSLLESCAHFVTLLIWCCYGVVDILFVTGIVNIASVNLLFCSLDITSKMTYISSFLYVHDIFENMKLNASTLDDVRQLTKINNILSQCTSIDSNITAYLRSVINRSIYSSGHSKLKSSVLNNIFFGDSLKELLEKGYVRKLYDGIGVLFIDIVNYTTIAKSLSPNELVIMMDEIYTTYDKTLRVYPELMKIETIGDAYMVVSGVHDLKNIEAQVSMKEHLTSLITFAIELLHNIQVRHNIKIRMGIHFGPAAMSIVGLDVPRCCFFGHTVNVSSRVQNVSKENAICITQEVYDHVKDEAKFDFSPMETVQLKGIGEANVCFVGNKHTIEASYRITKYN